MMQTAMLRSWIPIAAIAGLLSAPGAGAAGLLEVDQTIFGMDCAPCAFGVERGLKKLPGVASVRVSLNDGRSVVRFNPDAGVGLEQIRAVVRDNGFTPKSATLTVAGTLVRDDQGWVLDAGGAGRYRLDAALLGQAAEPGRAVTLRAQAAEDVADRLSPLPAR